MNILAATCCGIVFTALLSMTTQADEKDERLKQSHEAVLDYLTSLDGVRIGKRIKLEDLQSECLRKTFDRCDFLLLRYPRYPIEVVPAAPLQVNNLFIVCDGKVTRISNEIELRDFFLQKFPMSADAEVMADGVRCWLFLAQELHQDGFVKFGNPSIKTADSLAEGVVDVTKDSGDGRLSVTMEFTKGKLSKVSSGGNVVPGARRLR